MLSTLQRVASHEMTIAEWIGLGLMLAAPYFVIGVVWLATHRGGSIIGTVVTWPFLMYASVCTG